MGRDGPNWDGMGRGDSRSGIDQILMGDDQWTLGWVGDALGYAIVAHF